MKAMRKITVPASKVRFIEGVQAINICDLIDAIFGEGASWGSVDYDVVSAAVQKWCRQHGAYYYAEERWDDDGMLFSYWKGAYQAKRYGFRIVVCEDLS